MDSDAPVSSLRPLPCFAGLVSDAFVIDSCLFFFLRFLFSSLGCRARLARGHNIAELPCVSRQSTPHFLKCDVITFIQTSSTLQLAIACAVFEAKTSPSHRHSQHTLCKIYFQAPLMALTKGGVKAFDPGALSYYSLSYIYVCLNPVLGVAVAQSHLANPILGVGSHNDV
jgi:hypothetical protein